MYSEGVSTLRGDVEMVSLSNRTSLEATRRSIMTNGNGMDHSVARLLVDDALVYDDSEQSVGDGDNVSYEKYSVLLQGYKNLECVIDILCASILPDEDICNNQLPIAAYKDKSNAITALKAIANLNLIRVEADSRMSMFVPVDLGSALDSQFRCNGMETNICTGCKDLTMTSTVCSQYTSQIITSIARRLLTKTEQIALSRELNVNNNMQL